MGRRLDNLRRIVAAVAALPVSIDLESGYGDAPGIVAATVAAAIETGAIGCNLEDSFPADGSLRATTDQAARLAELGVARISHGPGPYSGAMRWLTEAAKAAMG